ncbi:MAG: hypothetical protein H0T89_13375 [Deltaproteobacteria bacterium]|nr:hypothetical protein [Deltaproteobacteria bacterium]
MSESVVRTVHVEDGVQSPLEMLPILAPDRMGELLATELEAQGFIRDGKTAKRTDPDGIEITVDLESATVSVKIGATADLQESIDRRQNVGVEIKDAAETRLRDDVMRDLDDRLAVRTEELRREITQRLEQKLGDLRKELDGAVGRATVSALTERASQLGQIESVVGDEAGNVTIKVKL